MKKCLSCGKILPDDSNFCQYCGSMDVKISVYCRKCGKEIPSDSLYCPYCGEPKEPVVQRQVEPVVAETKSIEKKESHPFKRLLSWLTLIGCFAIFLIVFAIIYYIAQRITVFLYGLPAILRLIAFLFGAGILVFGLLITPLTHGIPLLVSASESVCPSKKGLRYILFGGFIAIDYLWAFISKLVSGHFSITHSIIGLFGLGLAYFGFASSKNK